VTRMLKGKTMLTSGIDNGTTTVSSSQTTTRGLNDLASEDFFRLLITELQSQDPMNPTDNKALMQEISTIRTMEQTSTLNTTLKTLASEQRFGSTAGLIGHYIAGTVQDSAGNNYEIQGLVIGVRFDKGGNAILELHNGKSLPAADVEQVTLVENLPADILAQLEAELGRDLIPHDDGEDNDDGGGDGDSGSDGSGSDGDGSGSSAKTIAARVATTGTSASIPASSAGNQVRDAAKKVDSAASLVEALLTSPIGFGL